jgi:nucleoside phosphorylase
MTDVNITPETVKDRVDFGIVSIREDEYEAVLSRLPPERIIHGRRSYGVTRLQLRNGSEYLVATVRTPEQGNLQAQAVAADMIEELNPQWILLVGIGGAYPDNEYTLGDVFLGTQVVDLSVRASVEADDGSVYEGYRTSGGQMQHEVLNIVSALPAIRPLLEKWNTPEKIGVERPPVNLSPKNFTSVDEKWRKDARQNLKLYFGKDSTRHWPEVSTGVIANGNVLTRNTQLAKQWKGIARHISVVEMELAGVYQAAWRLKKPVLSIRGISDIVGYNRSREWTKYACNTAAAFTYAFLRYGPIPARGFASELLARPNCYLCYADADVRFARVLHSELASHGVDCWFREDRPGASYAERREAIKGHDKFLLVLSKNLLQDTSLMKEIAFALKIEKVRKRKTVVPVKLDNAVDKTDITQLQRIRASFEIELFRKWRDRVYFEEPFRKLLESLKRRETL